MFWCIVPLYTFTFLYFDSPGSSKYGTTCKYILGYYTPKHPIRLYTLGEVDRDLATENNQCSNPHCSEWARDNYQDTMMYATHYCSSVITGIHIRLPLSILSCRQHSYEYANPKVDLDFVFFKDTRSSAVHMHVGNSVSVNTGTLLLQDCDTKTGINNRTMNSSPN